MARCEHRAALGLKERKAVDWFGPVRIVLTFALVTIGWVFFRARRWGKSLHPGADVASFGEDVVATLQFWAAAIVLFCSLGRAPQWFERLAECRMAWPQRWESCYSVGDARVQRSAGALCYFQSDPPSSPNPTQLVVD